MFNDLKSAFFTLSSDDFRLQTLWAEIILAYTQRQRFYHNLKHLSFMLSSLKAVSTQLIEPKTVLAALFYHDFVYEISSTQNEEDSAEVAKNRLEKLNWMPTEIQKVQNLILATKHHQSTADFDMASFIDADIAILGAPETEYLQYARKIRKEYIQYPDALYQQGRTAVLHHFLAQESLFKTPYFQAKYQLQAKNNIKKELDVYL